MNQARPHRLPRDVRIRSSKDYQRIHARGRRFRSARIMVLALPGEAGWSRVGLSVSRKVGNAVRRNRVKRWIREAARRLLPDLSGCWDVVIIASPLAADAGAGSIADEVSATFARIGAWKT